MDRCITGDRIPQDQPLRQKASEAARTHLGGDLRNALRRIEVVVTANAMEHSPMEEQLSIEIMSRIDWQQAVSHSRFARCLGKFVVLGSVVVEPTDRPEMVHLEARFFTPHNHFDARWRADQRCQAYTAAAAGWDGDWPREFHCLKNSCQT
jgi:hypothetical protein